MHHFNVDTNDARVSVFTAISSILSGALGLIKIDTVADAATVAVISTLIGFYGNKVLRKLDTYLKERKERKKNKDKAV